MNFSEHKSEDHQDHQDHQDDDSDNGINIYIGDDDDDDDDNDDDEHEFYACDMHFDPFYGRSIKRTSPRHMWGIFPTHEKKKNN